jgi:hypothetical protein
MFARRIRKRSSHPSYYNGRIEAGYLDENMEPINHNSTEDFNKEMYYNYREFLRRKSERTGNPPTYLPFYSPNLVDEAWEYHPDFRNNYDPLTDDVYAQSEHNKRLYSVLGPEIVPHINPRSYNYIDRVRAILAAPLIVDWINELNLTI